MKTLMGARLNDMRPYESSGATFSQAAFRWVLSNPHVDGLIVSMTSTADIDEYVAASGSGPTSAADMPLLVRYAALQGQRYCRHACNACEASCPAGVEISEVLRTRMYDVDYRDPVLARADYAGLGAGARRLSHLRRHAVPERLSERCPISVFARDAAARLG